MSVCFHGMVLTFNFYVVLFLRDGPSCYPPATLPDACAPCRSWRSDLPIAHSPRLTPRTPRFRAVFTGIGGNRRLMMGFSEFSVYVCLARALQGTQRLTQCSRDVLLAWILCRSLRFGWKNIFLVGIVVLESWATVSWQGFPFSPKQYFHVKRFFSHIALTPTTAATAWLCRVGPATKRFQGTAGFVHPRDVLGARNEVRTAFPHLLRLSTIQLVGVMSYWTQAVVIH